VACADGAQPERFHFDETNAGAGTALEAVDVALTERSTFTSAELTESPRRGDFADFLLLVDGTVRARATVEDHGGSWRVDELVGCRPYLHNG
jgi:hypothetical protein